MVRKKYTEEQIIAVLKEAEAGAKLPDLCRKYGMSDATYYNWKAKYSGMTTSDLKRLKALEEENRRLKQIITIRVVTQNIGLLSNIPMNCDLTI
jgi:putative transposase